MKFHPRSTKLMQPAFIEQSRCLIELCWRVCTAQAKVRCPLKRIYYVISQAVCSRPPSSSARGLSSLLFCVLALLTAACSDSTPQAPLRAEVRVAVVPHQIELRARNLHIEAVGTSRARASAVIYPKTGGEAEQVLFSPGDFIEAGAPLLKLESKEEALAVRLANVEVQAAEQLLARYRRIEVSGAVSDSQIDEAQTALDAARVALDQAQLALDERTVRAPFAGFVGLTDIDPGARIDTSTAIAQLDDRSVLFVDFQTPEEVFGYLRLGESLLVTAFDGAQSALQAQIVGVDSRIDPTNRSVTVRAQLDNSDDRLRPGMSFRVQVNYQGEHYPAVPESALLWGTDGPYLWRLNGDLVERADVAIVAREAGYVLVRGDLSEGSQIVLEGIQKVRDGTRVTRVGGVDLTLLSMTGDAADTSR